MPEATSNQNQAERIAYLQKQIKAAEKKLKISMFLIIAGVVIMIAIPVGALGAYLETGGQLNWSWASLVVPMGSITLFGLALLVFGFSLDYYYRSQLGLIERERYLRGCGAIPERKLDIQSYLNEHQRRLTVSLTKPRCPNCGNEVPEDNFEFCPFCGKSLKP